ncbi:MAG: T9SS type A sorting domain-containing protein, partial [Bacteroidales bacterium]
KFLSLLVALLTVFNSQAAGVIKVNGEEIKKTPTLITLDYSKAGYIQVQFSDSSVVSYNMNLVEFCPNEVNAIQNTMKEGTFFHIKGHVRDVLHLEGITSGAEIAVYSANGEQKYLGKSNGENMSVDVSRLIRGVYVLRVGRQAVKFIKE